MEECEMADTVEGQEPMKEWTNQDCPYRKRAPVFWHFEAARGEQILAEAGQGEKEAIR